MRTPDIHIDGLGAYLPERIDTRANAAPGCDEDVYRLGGWTGATVAGDLPAPEMAARAGIQALERSSAGPADIGYLLYCGVSHQGPDLWTPPQYVQRRTIGGRVPAVEIRQTCNGMLAALELAAFQLAGAATGRAVLIAGADNWGHPMIDRWRYASAALRSSRPSILGDGGAAAVLVRGGGFARLLAVGSASLPELEEMYRAGRPVFPPDCTVGRSADLDSRFKHYEKTGELTVADAMALLNRARTDVARQVLDEAGVTPDQVTRVTHVFTGVAGYLQLILRPLGIDPARGMLELGRGIGHMGVGDQLVGLNHLVETGQVGPGDHVLMMSNGAGAAVAAAVVAIDSAPAWGVAPCPVR